MERMQQEPPQVASKLYFKAGNPPAAPRDTPPARFARREEDQASRRGEPGDGPPLPKPRLGTNRLPQGRGKPFVTCPPSRNSQERRQSEGKHGGFQKYLRAGGRTDAVTVNYRAWPSSVDLLVQVLARHSHVVGTLQGEDALEKLQGQGKVGLHVLDGVEG